MYTYNDQIEMLENIIVKEGHGININCPFCGGRKTLGIAIRDGRKLWHCFKVSCGVRGSKTVGMSTNTLRRKLNGVSTTQTKALLDIPTLLSSPENHPAVIKYLEDNNSIEAYREGLVRVEYAPADKRVLFFSQSGSGAVGRSLVGDLPKWKQYGWIDGLLKVGSGSTAIVVEDVNSACVVGMLPDCSGCALLGTVLSTQQKTELCHFTNVVIALDKDASKKAIKLKERLDGRVNVKVIFLEDDIKCIGISRSKKILRI